MYQSSFSLAHSIESAARLFEALALCQVVLPCLPAERAETTKSVMLGDCDDPAHFGLQMPAPGVLSVLAFGFGSIFIPLAF
jgi:hypothetical protein